VLSKGQRVIVIGRNEESEYTTREGETKKKWQIIADDVALSLRWASGMTDLPSPTSPKELPEDPF